LSPHSRVFPDKQCQPPGEGGHFDNDCHRHSYLPSLAPKPSQKRYHPHPHAPPQSAYAEGAAFRVWKPGLLNLVCYLDWLLWVLFCYLHGETRGLVMENEAWVGEQANLWTQEKEAYRDLGEHVLLSTLEKKN
jgi:hypothetical protein